MNPKLAQIILAIFNVLAIPLVAYAIYDFVSIREAVLKGTQYIPFDSGVYYFFLISIFWVFSFIQIVAKSKYERSVFKYAPQLVVGWFLAMLVVANVLPYYLVKNLENAGYTKCEDPAEISRVSKGESNIYSKTGCTQDPK